MHLKSLDSDRRGIALCMGWNRSTLGKPPDTPEKFDLCPMWPFWGWNPHIQQRWNDRLMKGNQANYWPYSFLQRTYRERWPWGYKTFFMLNSAEHGILIVLQLYNQRTNGPVKRSPDIWAKHKIKFGSKWRNHFWGKPVLIFKCKWPWAKVKKWPWPSILTYLHYITWFQVTGCKSSEKSTVFTFSYR